MLQACSLLHDSLCEGELLLFGDEFCQSVMKDLQCISMPPQPPPMKPRLGMPPSTVDQSELVSEVMMQDSDFLHLDWNCDFTPATVEVPLLDDCMWQTGWDKQMEDKRLPVLSMSPLPSHIDAQIFDEIAGSSLDCHNVALTCQALESDDLPLEKEEQIGSPLEYGSLFTGGESPARNYVLRICALQVCIKLTLIQQMFYFLCSTDEVIDVVSVRRSSALTHSQDHNYTAPRPASPPPAPPPCSTPPLKRSSVLGGSHRNLASRQGTDKEEERRRKLNMKERQRSNELNTSFLKLCNHIPELSNNKNASKIVILEQAKDSIRNLEAENKRKNQELGRLVERNCWLKARLDKLKGP
ncbi:N-myc proto-oncogene protein [Triplophysa tibetana]|uniref:N-myc proto-oncogene protein n=1 Tax=Triplophysa tibetana TaxID=1572043 RepID=A0A5A9PCY2_9TELE|nr:N-myc proto-oncogene protein [Triplophysa tibetana]